LHNFIIKIFPFLSRRWWEKYKKAKKLVSQALTKTRDKGYNIDMKRNYEQEMQKITSSKK